MTKRDAELREEVRQFQEDVMARARLERHVALPPPCGAAECPKRLCFVPRALGLLSWVAAGRSALKPLEPLQLRGGPRRLKATGAATELPAVDAGATLATVSATAAPASSPTSAAEVAAQRDVSEAVDELRAEVARTRHAVQQVRRRNSVAESN